MKRLLLFFAALIGLQASAIAKPRSSFRQSPADCGTVDLRPYFGEVRSQGNMGWCYANASADLLTFQFRSELHGEQVSASHLALSFNRTFGQSTSEGGFASYALNMSQFEGLCPRSIEENLLKKGVQAPLKSRIQGLVNLKKNFDASHGASLESDLKKNYSQNGSLLSKMPIADLRSVLESSTVKNFVSNFANHLCGSRKVIPTDKSVAVGMLKYPMFGWTGPLIDLIHSKLDHKQPIVIDYFADLFDADHAKPTNDGRHSSIVVGRKWNPQTARCDLLIRNSWGTGCSQYKAASLQNACEAGNVYVGDTVLANYIFGTVYFLKDRNY